MLHVNQYRCEIHLYIFKTYNYCLVSSLVKSNKYMLLCVIYIYSNKSIFHLFIYVVICACVVSLETDTMMHTYTMHFQLHMLTSFNVELITIHLIF